PSTHPSPLSLHDALPICPLLREPALTLRVVGVEVDQLDHHEPLGQPQRRLDRVGQPLLDALANHQTVDDDLDVVLELLLQRGRLDRKSTRLNSSHVKISY